MSPSLTILGSSSAIPTQTRNTTAQFLQFQNHKLLIDCGESCINRLIRYKLPFDQISYVFISHLHADHILGLPGLLSSFSLRNRIQPLTIFSPKGLQDLIKPLIGSKEHLSYKLIWTEVDPTYSQIILEENEFTVKTIPLAHRVPTTGFLFREKEKQPNLKKEAIKKYSLSVEQIKEAKAGLSVFDRNGLLIDNQELTTPPKPPKSYAYCSDTMYHESIIELIKGVDLLYHEATYLHTLQKLAKERGHATAQEAALIAKKAKVKKLLMGHFSTRYPDASLLQDEAQLVFPNTIAVEDGDTFEF